MKINICDNCNNEYEVNKFASVSRFCSNKCKGQYQYNASKIIIKENNEMINDPRFDWKTIQNEMDRLFKADPELSGYDIQFDFKKSDSPSRALIKVNLFNKK